MSYVERCRSGEQRGAVLGRSITQLAACACALTRSMGQQRGSHMPIDEKLGLSTMVWGLYLLWIFWIWRASLTVTKGERKVEHEQEHPALQSSHDSARVVSLVRSDSPYFLNEELAAGLREIERRHTSFSISGFLAWASAMFEVVVVAYSEGDRERLRSALSNDVYETFKDVIERRECRGEAITVSFVRAARCEILSTNLHDKGYEITVRFCAETFTSKKNLEGATIEGDQKSRDSRTSGHSVDFRPI